MVNKTFLNDLLEKQNDIPLEVLKPEDISKVYNIESEILELVNNRYYGNILATLGSFNKDRDKVLRYVGQISAIASQYFKLDESQSPPHCSEIIDYLISLSPNPSRILPHNTSKMVYTEPAKIPKQIFERSEGFY